MIDKEVQPPDRHADALPESRLRRKASLRAQRYGGDGDAKPKAHVQVFLALSGLNRRHAKV